MAAFIVLQTSLRLLYPVADYAALHADEADLSLFFMQTYDAAYFPFAIAFPICICFICTRLFIEMHTVDPWRLPIVCMCAGKDCFARVGSLRSLIYADEAAFFICICCTSFNTL